MKESARQVGGQLQQQIQSRLSRVARSGLKRLTSKTVLGSGSSFDRCFVPVQFQYERPKVESEVSFDLVDLKQMFIIFMSKEMKF